jgi:hypothetical protein
VRVYVRCVRGVRGQCGGCGGCGMCTDVWRVCVRLRGGCVACVRWRVCGCVAGVCGGCVSGVRWRVCGGVAGVAQDRPAGTVFRPHAIYNPATALYVLYWNYVHPNGSYAGYAAATSASPAGPFTLQVCTPAAVR